MLSAFELGSLSKDDAERFSVHVLECDYCLAELKELLPFSTILRQHDETREALRAYSAECTRDNHVDNSWRRLLWPDVPFFFRPAVSYTVAFIIAIFAILSVSQKEPAQSTQNVQGIRLYQIRTAANPEFLISSGLDGLISLNCPEADHSREYSLSIISTDNDTLLINPAFSFDRDKWGYVLIPHDIMRPGRYRLQIVSTASLPPEDLLANEFTIKR